MPSCEGSNCNDVEVKFAAKLGSPYLIYRDYKVKEGEEYKLAPIIVSMINRKNKNEPNIVNHIDLIFRRTVTTQ